MALRVGLALASRMAALLLLAACNAEPVADGESCAEASDCKSELCVTTGPGEGYCAGRRCSMDGADAECAPGYVCFSSGGGILGGGSAPRCVPTCSQCPDGQSCPAGAAPEDTTCAP